MFSAEARIFGFSSSAKQLDSVLFQFSSFLVLAVKTKIAWQSRLQNKFSLYSCTKSVSSDSHTYCDIAVYKKFGIEQLWK